jgi:hypothetical protein
MEIQTVFTEQQAYTPRYPLQDDFSLHFADANAEDADMVRNTDIFDNIDDLLTSDATKKFTEIMKLNVVKGH